VTGYIKSGIRDGATVHLGAGSEGELEEGYFVKPTIFTNIHPQMKIVKEEIFGPVSAIIKFSTEQGTLLSPLPKNLLNVSTLKHRSDRCSQ